MRKRQRTNSSCPVLPLEAWELILRKVFHLDYLSKLGDNYGNDNFNSSINNYDNNEENNENERDTSNSHMPLTSLIVFKLLRCFYPISKGIQAVVVNMLANAKVLLIGTCEDWKGWLPRAAKDGSIWETFEKLIDWCPKAQVDLIFLYPSTVILAVLLFTRRQRINHIKIKCDTYQHCSDLDFHRTLLVVEDDLHDFNRLSYSAEGCFGGWTKLKHVSFEISEYNAHEFPLVQLLVRNPLFQSNQLESFSFQNHNNQIHVSDSPTRSILCLTGSKCSLKNFSFFSKSPTSELHMTDFSGFRSLQNIDFRHNVSMGTLPESLQQCVSLKRLNLENSKISYNLPLWIATMPNLTELSVGPYRNEQYHRVTHDENAQLRKLLDKFSLNGNTRLKVLRVSLITDHRCGSDSSLQAELRKWESRNKAEIIILDRPLSKIEESDDDVDDDERIVYR